MKLSFLQQADAKILVKSLLEVKIEFDQPGATPFHDVVRNGQIALVSLLLIYRADVNSRNKNQQTALHLANLRNQGKILELLLCNKAQINSKDNQGLTPLHYAATNGLFEHIKILVENGAAVNQTTDAGISPLFYLGYYFQPKQDKQLKERNRGIKYLVEHNANVDGRPIHKLPLLYYAAYHKQRALFFYLWDKSIAKDVIEVCRLPEFRQACDNIEAFKHESKHEREQGSLTRVLAKLNFFGEKQSSIAEIITSYIFQK